MSVHVLSSGFSRYGVAGTGCTVRGFFDGVLWFGVLKVRRFGFVVSSVGVSRRGFEIRGFRGSWFGVLQVGV